MSSDAAQYVAEDGSIRVQRLVGTLLAAAVTLFGAVQIELLSTLVGAQVALIDFVGRLLTTFVTNALGESAGLVTDSWRAAAVAAVEFGPFAPVLMALEAIAVLLIVVTIWDRRGAIW
ncbi:hypothetical protein GJR96_09295 [Haloferax sp. MBLA0076]|uniref:Uncharacterized protein n=1 Tax=Haloferax litoreum TaxID=2666140 RepID=A0A6A8GG67_9EURY|nr:MULTISPECIES: hypothetical protein [Haloferax]KAB1193624.1 hypothetical protein Hfx1148_09280 [Haloferax sp. CBA1148]MRX22148.1 hypothetical protein [Haloferax litoreum]